MKLNKKNVRTILLIILGSIIVYTLIQNISQTGAILAGVVSLLRPILIGVLTALILVVPMRAFENRVFSRLKRLKKGAVRALSMVSTLLSFFGLVFAVIVLFIPNITRFTLQIAELVPGFINQVQVFLTTQLDNPDYQRFLQQLNLNWNDIANTIANALSTIGTTVFNSTWLIITNVAGGIMNFIIGLVFACYALMQREKLAVNFKSLAYAYLKKGVAEKIIYIAHLTRTVFGSFIAGQTLGSLILTCLCFVMLLIVGVGEYAAVIAVFVGFCSFIPVFGSIVGAAVGAFLILLLSPSKALAFLICYVIIQQCDEYFIYPHIVGSRIGLPAIWVLFAVTVGGAVMGILGMVLFIPLTSVVYTLLRSSVSARLEERGIERSRLTGETPDDPGPAAPDGQGGSVQGHGPGQDPPA